MTRIGRVLTEYIAKVCENSAIRRGLPLPFGTQESEGGVNFAFFSRHATRTLLEFFDKPEDSIASKVIELDPLRHRTGDIWHVWVKGVPIGQLYGYRIDGPYQPDKGQRFNFNKLLLDPYARAITQLPLWDFNIASDPNAAAETAAAAMPKCIYNQRQFDWQQELPLKHPWSETIIYETHVRGFTVHESSAVKHPGSYRGLIEKIPYLKALGITAVELMPIYEFNDTQVIGSNPLTGAPLTDYWGYDPVNFFAVKGSYSSAGGLGQQILEFKQMVLELHKADIEVILDVVFNHTAEDDENGPTICFRGIDNVIFYILEDDKRYYKRFAGTGNTINASQPVVRDHILDALRYWVIEMHVDGFRFDLATILGLDNTGKLLEHAPLLHRIAEDPILRDIKIIAEAWDAAGAYEAVGILGHRWAGWNGHYRDEVRCFWRGDAGKLGAFAQRLCGSADIFAKYGKNPQNGINFISCHDGFTLNDLVSYKQKHNIANNQNNQDGNNENYSENYGVEGPTTDVTIAAIRKRQIKNFLLTLLVSRGTPMLLGGDEFRRTQEGNNNPYCQDNEISWYNWNYLTQHNDIFEFTRGMIAFRKAHPILSKEEFYTDNDITWLSPAGTVPDWLDSTAKKLACLIHESATSKILFMFNASIDDVEFNLPPLPAEWHWYLIVDTAHDNAAMPGINTAPLLLNTAINYSVRSRGSAILVAQP